MLQQKVYSKSLKKLKKQQVFDYSIQRLYKMQEEIQKSAQTIQIKEKPIQNYILARKQLIQHKHSKNKLQQQVDKIMRSLVDSNHLELKNKQINQKHHYQHYRIDTEPIEQGSKMRNKRAKTLQNQQEEDQSGTNNKQRNIITIKQVENQDRTDNRKLPRIQKSASHSGFQQSKSRKLRAQHQLIQRLSENPKNKLLDYINIDSAIRQYRSGMTSLIKGVYYNPHNPYKK